MAGNSFIDFMTKVNEFSTEERAKASASFRNDLKTYKLSGAIMKIAESGSDKVPLYINVICQQCRKKSFAVEFNSECDRLKKQYFRTRPEIYEKIRDLLEVVKLNAQI